ncbi:MAG: apolipoprotein N-acyltransferase [Bdellovibrionaceae bacterium]|nr:apolipoprotein N-acyltransferase [Pseudobdellovibrionaceae bacterium]
MMAWLSQFVFTLIGFNWIYYTATEFGHLHPAISAAALLLFAASMNIYVPIAVITATWLKRNFQLSITQHIFLFALTMSIAERIWPGIFQWNLGYTLLWMKWPMFQWADTVGFLGLSSIIFLIQATLLTATLHFKTNKKMFLGLVGGIFLLLVAMHLTGLSKEQTWSQTDQSVSFSITQGNIGNEEKLISELGRGFQSAIVGKYISLVNEYLNKKTLENPQFKTDIILWPETAMPLPMDTYFSRNPLQNQIQSQVKLWNSVLITGAFSHDQFKRDHLGSIITRNSVFFLGPEGQQQPAYYKSQLLVFGEYMPFGEILPVLYKLLPFVGTFEPGPGPVAKKLSLANQRTVMIGPQICYESLDPEFSRGLAKKGTDIILNVTNDSWFGDWAEPYQHMTMTLARGVEVRRPLVRATNTGFSSVILANGHELERSSMNQVWMSTYDVPYKSNASLSNFTLWGHWDWMLLIFGFIFIIINRPLKSGKNK